MDILRKPIEDITFDEVVEFCELKIIEGINLEYKSDFPRDLAKQFVTFSNTQGGLIILGVSEDEKTGLPDKWDGIDPTAKPIDRVYQIAANVVPFPTFEVSQTDSKNEKVFILIRILEGASPPYGTNSDPTPWVRNGNTSAMANREEQLRLSTKRDKAQLVREAALKFSQHTFDLDIANAEYERQTKQQSGETDIYGQRIQIGSTAAIFNISVMPFYPDRELISYDSLSNPSVFLGKEWQNTAFIHGFESIPGGISSLHWNRMSGQIVSNQIYLNGHSDLAYDVLSTNQNDPPLRVVYIAAISEAIHKELEIAKTIFEKSRYNGQVSIHASLRGGVNAVTYPMNSRFMSDGSGKIKFNDGDYHWEDDTNTAIMRDEGLLAALHIGLLKKIGWDIGLKEIPDSEITDFFKLHHWYGL